MLGSLSTSLDRWTPSHWFVHQGWTWFKPVYDLYFRSVDKFYTIRIVCRATLEFIFLECRHTKKITIYVNEAQRNNYLTIVTRPLTSPGKPIFFSEEDANFVHFSHNDALVVTVHIGCCKVSKILVDGVNILYSDRGGTSTQKCVFVKSMKSSYVLMYPRYFRYSIGLTGCIHREGRR